MKKAYFGLVFIAILFLAACSGAPESVEKEASSGEKAEKAVLTIHDMAGRTVTFDKLPKRIITLTNSDMNIVYALGGKVVGRQTQDASGVKPEEAKSATEVGNTHDLNLEKIAALAPDVIVASSEQNLKDVPALEAIGAKVVLTGANSVDDIKTQTEVLGKLLGAEAKAKELNQTLTEREEAIQTAQAGKHVRALMILGAPGSNYAALPTSLSGDTLRIAGGMNVAENLKGVENFPQYAALNIEKIVAEDPEVIFLMIHGGDEKETEEAFRKEMEQNDAWNSTTAVKNGDVMVLPADLFGTNPGVRIEEALDYMTQKLNQVAK